MGNKTQQTGVDYIVEQVEDFIGLIPVDIIEKAKEIEKNRMIKLIQFVVSEKELSYYGSITKETANYYLNKFNKK
jgi:hypothetical protein